jgi:small GTP-binding protein
MTDNNLLKIKIVFIGEPFVGKTCIINRYVDNNYKENPGSTIGSNYTSKKITIPDLNKEVILDIWDTAGQEVYRSFVKLFYKESKIAILVYDISDRKSFDELKKYWFNEIKEFSKDIIIGIAGNKSDLIDKEEVNEDEARKFAKEINASFRLTSALSNIGIEELFLELTKKYLEEKKEEINENKSLYEISYILEKSQNKSSISIEHKKKKKKFCC